MQLRNVAEIVEYRAHKGRKLFDTNGSFQKTSAYIYSHLVKQPQHDGDITVEEIDIEMEWKAYILMVMQIWMICYIPCQPPQYVLSFMYQNNKFEKMTETWT